MPLVVPPTIAGRFQTNLTPTSRTGTTITGSATANQKGSWYSLIDPTSYPSYGIFVRICNVGANNALHNVLIDIAYGPTGGGNEQIIIPDINGSSAGISGDLRNKLYFFPVYIPAGVRVSGRLAANTASKTAVVAVWLCQWALYPWVGDSVVAYGVDSANSRGTSVTPGNGAFGSWTLIGQTVKDHKYFAVGVGNHSSTSLGNMDEIIEIGIGPDSSNVTTIYTGAFHVDNAELVDNVFPPIIYAPVKSGTNIYARIASGDTVAIGVIVYGI